MPVLPHPLPSEVVEGEHFVLADLLKSFPRGSSQEEAVPKPLVKPNYLPLAIQDPKPTPKRQRKKKKKSEQTKAAGKGLEGFVDRTDPKISNWPKRERLKGLSFSLGLLCRCTSEVPALRRRTPPASKFLAANVLGSLDLMRSSKLIWW